MGPFLRDARHALRGLLRRPGFTLAAVATLSLAVGANTAIFSVVHAVLLRPLPFPEPERLVRIEERHGDGRRLNLTGATFRDLRQRAGVLAHAAVFRVFPFNLFALLLSVTASVLFGLGPALQAARTDIRGALVAGAPGAAGPARARVRGGLVVAEVALVVVLLGGAGLLARDRERDPGREGSGRRAAEPPPGRPRSGRDKIARARPRPEHRRSEWQRDVCSHWGSSAREPAWRWDRRAESPEPGRSPPPREARRRQVRSRRASWPTASH